jgi:hypothetical protein
MDGGRRNLFNWLQKLVLQDLPALSMYVLADEGVFATRDELFEKFDVFYNTVREDELSRFFLAEEKVYRLAA